MAIDSWKNRYTINVNDTPSNAIIYANQMGYEYIAIRASYGNLTTNNPYKLYGAGLSFFITDPYYDPECYASLPKTDANGKTITYPRVIDITPGTGFVYTQAQKDWYNERMTWKNTGGTWPNNLANGGLGSGTNYTRFAPFWDFQQQAAIDEVSSNILIAAANYASSNKANMPFAGVYFDVPKLTGVFYADGTGSPATSGVITLAYWTGTDSGASHIGIDGTTTKQYALYSDGMAAFYKKLIPDMKAIYPSAKWLIEPARVYKAYISSQTWTLDEYVWNVSQRADKVALTPDMLSEEGPTTEFVDTAAIFSSGMPITASMVGSQMSSSGSNPNGIIDEVTNRTIAGKAGVNGAWFNWSILFGNSGTAGTWTNITQVYPRLKLVKCVPNWDNLNNILLANRSWNGSVYQSTNSYISKDVIYSRHWKTAKLYAVFVTTNGIINLNAGEIVTSVQRTDGYFRESGDGAADVTISGLTIRINSGLNTDKGYIFTIASQATNPPTATTLAATNIAIDTASLNATVNANNLSTTLWFQYGTDPQLLYNETIQIVVTGTLDNAITIDIGSLSASILYYFRIVARNNTGTTYGNMLSFATIAETTKPAANSITINNGNLYTNNLNVILNLSAIDNIGVIGYYLSTSATVPGVGDPGWVAINSTQSYQANIVYTLSAGEGTKTIYVWYKDAAGNVSDTINDTIIVDTTAPTIGITIPTANPTSSSNLDIVSLGGYTSDDISGVKRVTWINDRGGNGTAAGTTTWTISAILLQLGINEIIVTAEDNAGNLKTDTIVITYTPTQPVEDLEAVINIWNLKRKRVRIMEAVYNNIVIKQGSTFVQRFTLKQSTGLPVDLTGYQIRAQIRKTPLSRTKLFDFVATILDAANGDIQISLTAEQTAILPQGEAAYDVEIFTSGNIERVIEGSCIITSEVTR